MRLLATPRHRTPKRHDLVFADPAKWDAILERHLGADRTEPVIRCWAAKGWPLVARRPMSHETEGISLGLPLPPSHGKRRVPLVLQPEEIVAVRGPAELAGARSQAPKEWQRTFDQLQFFAAQRDVELRVFGSLAWQFLTGLPYVTLASDLDLLFYVHGPANMELLCSEISEIEDGSPSRIDGEFIRYDGIAVNWREFMFGPTEILVKSMNGVGLLDRKHFLVGDFLQ